MLLYIHPAFISILVVCALVLPVSMLPAQTFCLCMYIHVVCADKLPVQMCCSLLINLACASMLPLEVSYLCFHPTCALFQNLMQRQRELETCMTPTMLDQQ